MRYGLAVASSIRGKTTKQNIVEWKGATSTFDSGLCFDWGPYLGSFLRIARLADGSFDVTVRTFVPLHGSCKQPGIDVADANTEILRSSSVSLFELEIAFLSMFFVLA